MAYSNYKAIVTCNGARRKDKEDTSVFTSDLDKFGVETDFAHHGILGDGNIRVIIHKQGIPDIYESENGIVKKIFFHENEIDAYDYPPILFEYKGYEFMFKSGRPYYAYMKEPNGNVWEALYDYGYNAE